MHVSKRYALSTLTYKISRQADDASYNGSTIELPSPCYTGSTCATHRKRHSFSSVQRVQSSQDLLAVRNFTFLSSSFCFLHQK